MLLEAHNVGYRYSGGPHVLKGVNFQLRAGEIVGLTGPSGGGKTTLARILAGFEKPQEGFVSLDGKPLPHRGYHPVQLVFQHPEKAVNPRWKMHRILKEGWNPPDELLDALGIERDWLYRWPNELSGGELQRFCIARALGPETRFLIADEITTMLDAITQAQIWKVILDFVERQNIGVLVISHEAPLLKRLCTRIVSLASLQRA